MKRLLSFKFWLRASLITALSVIVLFLGVVALAYWQQKWVVQRLLSWANENYKGEIVIKGSHISAFANFPYISIDLEDLYIYEEKDRSNCPIVKVKDAYLGFDFWTIISGKYDLKSIKLSEGDLNLIQHKDGSINLTNALSPSDTTAPEEAAAPFEINLKSLTFKNIDFHKFNETTETDIDLYINNAKAKFKQKGSHIVVGLDSKFEMNVIQSGDTTFIKHKHFNVHTNLDYDGDKESLQIAPSEVSLEMGHFKVEGNVDMKNEMYVDIKVHGAKPNFDLFIAFAPEELIPTLKSYDNEGKIFFEAQIKGKTANGQMPAIDAQFGCEDGFISNNMTRKKLHDMDFKGYFTNGSKRDLSTMEFGLSSFKAKPDAGIFSGNLKVVNFIEPDIKLQLISEFNLEFIAKFFNMRNLEDMSGSIALEMNFHDIIDLRHPEKSIEKLNESYYTKLKIKDLSFRSTNFHLPVENINMDAEMEGHKAVISLLRAKVGKSDINISGSISDLPAILHHSDEKIQADLLIESALLDFAELTYNDSLKKSTIDEQAKDLSLSFSFLTSAKAVTESPNLPVGEFIIRDFHASLKHYPHKLHDFHADIFIENEDIRIVDFSGEIDGSDFHFSGKMKHYEIMLKPKLNGDTNIEFDLVSEHIRLEDLFSYGGENYVPADYRHEDFRKLQLHGRTDLHFRNNALHSVDCYIDKLSCTMKVHNSRFENFSGRLHFEDEHLVVEKLSGQIGRSDFQVYLNYYLGKNPAIRKRDNFFSIKSRRLDIDQLIAYNPSPNTKETKPEDHEAGFNIFELPFTDIRVEADIAHLTYHKYLIEDLKTKIRMQQNHYLYSDECSFRTAGGRFDVKGYFNGSNPKEIYFSPDIVIDDVDLDKLMVKFENFGQDHLVSENLHGRLSCAISGKLRMHADMVPIINKSELLMDVTIINGMIENYKPLEFVADYFKDKNLSKVRFDTLKNEFEFKDNKLIIPKMTINSSLGFLELWGEQDMDMNMDYYFKIPLKLVSQAAFQKLFKRKKEEVDLDQEDAIQYQDTNKKIAYVHVNLKGNLENYSISLKRDKRQKKERKRKLRNKNS
jgi:hypothetical protein